MDISARANSLAEKPQWAIRITSVRMRREDRTSISFHPLADLGGQPRLFSNAHAACSLLVSKARPPAKTPHAMRASLLAGAIARRCGEDMLSPAPMLCLSSPYDGNRLKFYRSSHCPDQNTRSTRATPANDALCHEAHLLAPLPGMTCSFQCPDRFNASATSAGM
jgi:hypothetical protein